MVLKWIVTVIIFAVAYFIYRLIVEAILRTAKRLKRPITMPNTMKTIIGVLILLIALMVVLDFWGKSFTALAASLGIGGIVIGLALQEPLSNLISGMFLLLSGAIREGDTVNIADYSGTVRAINVNHTIIETFDGKKVMIPNKTVWSSSLMNYWPSTKRRIDLDIGISYNSDMKKAVEVLNKCLNEVDLIEKEPAPFVVFTGFDNSSINFQVKFWVRRENYFDAQMALAIKIKEEFDREGIEIPFPQVDVHMKS
ncbi:MAG: mechanosensitive ion channel family protein [Thermotogaceae bacterium]|nr:mechanosensitive ion channel family protein [Thermotogaceae bacterium]